MSFLERLTALAPTNQQLAALELEVSAQQKLIGIARTTYEEKSQHNSLLNSRWDNVQRRWNVKRNALAREVATAGNHYDTLHNHLRPMQERREAALALDGVISKFAAGEHSVQDDALTSIINWDKPVSLLKDRVEFCTTRVSLIETLTFVRTPEHFGPYQVIANLHRGRGGNTVEVTVKKAGLQVNTVEGRIHPHISGGTACLAEFATPLIRDLDAGNYPAVLITLCTYLQTYNPGSPYLPVHNWLPNNPWNNPHCRTCKKPLAICTCPRVAVARCVHCTTDTNLSPCGSCVYCCAQKHKFSLTMANTGKGYGGTGCW